MFPRALKALNISPNARMEVITSLDCQSMKRRIENLRQVSVELRGVYSAVVGKGDSAHGSIVETGNAVTE